MKYVLISLSESSKIDFSGAEKLSKTDHIVFLYVKGKKTLPASVKSALEDVVAEIEYFEMSSASELIPCASYLIGYHEASKHDVIVITEDKSKLPSKVTKDIKVYSAFKSIAGTSSTSKKTTTAKKSTTTKKTTGKKVDKIIFEIGGKQIDMKQIEKKAEKFCGTVYVVANERKIYDSEGNSINLF